MNSQCKLDGFVESHLAISLNEDVFEALAPNLSPGHNLARSLESLYHCLEEELPTTGTAVARTESTVPPVPSRAFFPLPSGGHLGTPVLVDVRFGSQVQPELDSTKNPRADISYHINWAKDRFIITSNSSNLRP